MGTDGRWHSLAAFPSELLWLSSDGDDDGESAAGKLEE